MTIQFLFFRSAKKGFVSKFLQLVKEEIRTTWCQVLAKYVAPLSYPQTADEHHMGTVTPTTPVTLKGMHITHLLGITQCQLPQEVPCVLLGCRRNKSIKFLLVPMSFWVLIQCRKHYGQNCAYIVTDQTHDVFIVPIIQSPLCHLCQVQHRKKKTEKKKRVSLWAKTSSADNHQGAPPPPWSRGVPCLVLQCRWSLS